MLNRNTTAEGTTVVVPPVTPPENGGTAAGNAQVIPLWKFKQANDKLKETENALKKYQEAEKQKQDEEAKAKGEFEKLILLERQEKDKLALEKAQLIEERKREKLESAVLKEVAKHSANDAEDVLKFVDISKLPVDENGQVTGLKEIIEKLKTDKPYLFGKVAGTAVDPNENGRPAPASDALKAVEAEYMQLLQKSQTPGKGLSPEEVKRLGSLTRQLHKLKSEQKK